MPLCGGNGLERSQAAAGVTLRPSQTESIATIKMLRTMTIEYMGPFVVIERHLKIQSCTRPLWGTMHPPTDRIYRSQIQLRRSFLGCSQSLRASQGGI